MSSQINCDFGEKIKLNCFVCSIIAVCKELCCNNNNSGDDDDDDDDDDNNNNNNGLRLKKMISCLRCLLSVLFYIYFINN